MEKKKIVIVGCGRSGLALAKFLIGKKAYVTVSDSASYEKIEHAVSALRGMGASVEYGGHSLKTFLESDLIILSPGVPHTLSVLDSARKKGARIMGEVEFAFRMIKTPIIAITGTNGKTTTTELTAEMLRQSGFDIFLGGNIGIPLTRYVELNEEKDVVVAEISSFQTDTMDTFCPRVGVLLNITEDHLDRYPSFMHYSDSKKRLFRNQTSKDVAVLNLDDPNIYSLRNEISSKVVGFSSIREDFDIPSAFIIKNRIIVNGRGDIPSGTIDLGKTALIGPHNYENIAASALSVLSFGGTFDGIQKVVDTFKGLPHRMERVASKGDIHFVNDSKATNVDAVKRALECFENPIILIMGGKNKDNDFGLLSGDIDRKVRELILIGEAKYEIRDALSPSFQRKAIIVESMREAIEKALMLAKSKDTVLLSPACASFDMYQNYEKRGEDFRKIVLELLT